MQQSYVETRCLTCDEPITVDFKFGGNRYCFCPACKHWTVLNHPSVNERLETVERKRYGYHREVAGSEAKEIIDSALDEIEAEAEAELANEAQ